MKAAVHMERQKRDMNRHEAEKIHLYFEISLYPLKKKKKKKMTKIDIILNISFSLEYKIGKCYFSHFVKIIVLTLTYTLEMILVYLFILKEEAINFIYLFIYLG